MVQKYRDRKTCEPLMNASIPDYVTSQLDDSQDAVLMAMTQGKVILDCVAKARTDLQQRFANMSQQRELLDKDTPASNHLKTNYEILLCEKYATQATAEHFSRLVLEKYDHMVQWPGCC